MQTVVDPGVEATFNSAHIDVLGESIRFFNFAGGSPGSAAGDLDWRLTDLDWLFPGPGQIVGAILQNVAGLAVDPTISFTSKMAT